MRAINVTLYRLAKALKVVKALQQMYDEMKPYTVKELMSKYGLKADRADGIIDGLYKEKKGAKSKDKE